MTSKRWAAFLLFLLFTAVGLLFTGSRVFDDLARGHSGTFLVHFIEEMTGAYTALIMVPIAVAVARWFPLGPRIWVKAAAAQTLAAIVYTLAHTTLMAATRAAIFPLAGLGAYDYGVMRFRYPMEALKDLIFYAMFAGFVYFYDRIRSARQAELAAAELQSALAQAKLENLRLQLHPHFLFNTLNAISSVMYEDVRKADAMLARLSDFLRVILTSTDVQEVSLAEEIAIEQMYVDIMKARLESKLQLRFNVDDGALDARVPSLILQPLLENAISHGMGSVRNELDIDVDVKRQNGHMEILVRDNGLGLDGASSPSSGHGHGLANVRSRLSHLYGERFHFAIANAAPAGTQVSLVFPFRSQ